VEELGNFAFCCFGKRV